jgi:hypothetical protein
MTIPVMYLWPLGCLAMIGLVHAVFAIEDLLHHIVHRSIDAVQRWRDRGHNL